MKIRFQADADLNQIILHATIRREPAIDFQSAVIAGLSYLGDTEVLTIAARQGRVLVIHDKKTMPRHFARYIITNPSPGLLVIIQIPQHHSVADVVEDLLLIWIATETSEWINRVCYLPL